MALTDANEWASKNRRGLVMKILVISTKCDKISISNLKVDIVSWHDNELGLINLRDYDGVVFDMSDYYLSPYNDNSMRGVFEHHSISPDIIYDVLKKPDTFVIVVGDPNTTVNQESILDLIGFSVSSEIRNGDTVIREKTGDRTFLKYLEKSERLHIFFERKRYHIESRSARMAFWCSWL